MRADQNGPSTPPPRLDVDRLLGDPRTRIVVCCGAGGVGKTTTAAAVALRAAEHHGRKAVVLTIDPAHRLAQSLGLTELDNVPRQVKGIDPSIGADGEPGDLHAMMLDMKRTFDEVVLSHTDQRVAEEIFENPFYQAMSATFSGTHEYMAMEKLGQLRATNQWDLIVVDTPPSRSALDFLDAPARLSRFLDGKMLRLLLVPARAGGHRVLNLFSASFGVFDKAVTRIIGTHLLTELSRFVGALDSMFGGFRERAEHTYQVLQAEETAFLVVAAPEPDAVREAIYFVKRLATDNMPLAGLLLNRVTTLTTATISAEAAREAAAALAELGDHATAVDVLTVHAHLVDRHNRQVRVAERFLTECPDVPVTRIAAQPTDVHDLDGLRTIGETLAAADPPQPT